MFSKIDLFGKPVELNFNGKDKSRSSAGAWFSLFFFGFIVWSICLLGKDLVYRKEPKTLASDSFQENPSPMVLSPETFNFGFGLQHPTTLAHYIDESVYTVETVREQLTRTVKEDGSIELKRTNTPLLVEACRKEHFGSLDSHFENIELNQLYCLQRNQPGLDKIRIQGVSESPLFEDVSVMIKQCDNQTSKVPCAPKETIDFLLGGGWFKTYFTNLAIDSKNYNHSNLGYRDSFYTSMSNNYFKQITLWLGHVEVSTDYGWVTEELERDHYIKLDHLQEYTSFRPTLNEMINFVIRVGKVTRNYDRSYTKAQDLIAKINGLVSISIIVGYIFIIPYSKIKFYERLINELFDVKTKKNKDKNFIKKRTIGGAFSSIMVDGDKIENEEDEEGGARPSHFPKKKYLSGSLSESPESLLRFGKNPWSNTKVLEHSQPSKNLSPIPSVNEKYKRKKRSQNSWSAGDKNKKFSKINTLEEKDEQLVESKPPKLSELNYQPPPPEIQAAPHLFQEKPKITELPRVKFPTMFEVSSVAIDLSPKTLKPTPSHEGPELPKEVKQASIFNNLDLAKNENFSSRIIESGKTIGNVVDQKEINKRAELIPAQLTKDSYHINITFGDYVRAYFWRTNELKEKFGLLEEGIRRIQERLNIFNLLKKLREVDKLKLLLLENEQFILFDGLPNPELSLKNIQKKKTGRKRSWFLKLKEAIFIADKKRYDLIKNSYIDLKKKKKPTMIDQKLLEIYDEIIDL